MIIRTSNHVIKDSFLSKFPIIFLELGDPLKAHGIPALMMLLRERSTMRMGDVWASRECVRHNTIKKFCGVSRFLLIEYLFYDKEEESEIIQTHKFKTLEDYVLWMNKLIEEDETRQKQATKQTSVAT